MEAIFFLLIFLVVYSYLIYPAAIWVLTRIRRNSWAKREISPRVTMIISVYNEEKVIGAKIRNVLSLNYARELLEVIVASDGSTDRTNEIVSGWKDPRLTLKAFTGRAGKTACLNRVVPGAKGRIVVFTDGNSMYAPDTVTKLVKSFFDPEVGLVTGWTRYNGGAERSGGIYSRLEMKTKYWESLLSSCVGADGAIFAMRKELFNPLEESDINDFVLPLQVISQGKRVVLDPEIFCSEPLLERGEDEFDRQARITNRTLRAIWKYKKFLNPFSHGCFSFFLFSHKVLRYLAPFLIPGVFLLNLMLLGTSSLYIILLFIQMVILTLGLVNFLGKFQGRLGEMCKVLLVTLFAQGAGWTRMLRGVSENLWTPQR